MKSTIVIVVLLLLAAYAAVQVGSMYLAKSDLEEFVNQALDTVDDSSKDEVKGNIVAKAQKLGIAISAKNIEVVYEDADAQLVAQRLVGQRIAAQYKNKRVVISFRYVAPAAGFQVNQQIRASKIRQISVQAPINKDVQELLDSQ